VVKMKNFALKFSVQNAVRLKFSVQEAVRVINIYLHVFVSDNWLHAPAFSVQCGMKKG